MSSLWRDAAISRTHILNKVEKEFRRENGSYTAYPWAEWGDRPRSCAVWSQAELKELDDRVTYLFDQYNQGLPLKAIQLAEIAWIHGRSANGIYDKLKQVYKKKFYHLIDNDLIQGVSKG